MRASIRISSLVPSGLVIDSVSNSVDVDGAKLRLTGISPQARFPRTRAGSAQPTFHLNSPFHSVHFYFPCATLDALAVEANAPHVGELH
jgi:hypothetical protein